MLKVYNKDSLAASDDRGVLSSATWGIFLRGSGHEVVTESRVCCFYPGGSCKFEENTADVGFDGEGTYGLHPVRGDHFTPDRIGKAQPDHLHAVFWAHPFQNSRSAFFWSASAVG